MKETTFTMRISHDLKIEAEKLAASEGRSLANYIQWLLENELRKSQT